MVEIANLEQRHSQGHSPVHSSVHPLQRRLRDNNLMQNSVRFTFVLFPNEYRM